MIDWVHKESVTRANVCDTCGHQYSDVCGGCESLDGVPIKYTEKWKVEIQEKEAEKKPPLGIKPRYVHDHERLAEIIGAMGRYSGVGKRIPGEWIHELKDLLGQMGVL